VSGGLTEARDAARWRRRRARDARADNEDLRGNTVPRRSSAWGKSREDVRGDQDRLVPGDVRHGGERVHRLRPRDAGDPVGGEGGDPAGSEHRDHVRGGGWASACRGASPPRASRPLRARRGWDGRRTFRMNSAFPVSAAGSPSTARRLHGMRRPGRTPPFRRRSHRHLDSRLRELPARLGHEGDTAVPPRISRGTAIFMGSLPATETVRGTGTGCFHLRGGAPRRGFTAGEEAVRPGAGSRRTGVPVGLRATPAKTSPSSRCAASTSFGLISMTGRLVVYTTFSAVLRAAPGRAPSRRGCHHDAVDVLLVAAARISAYGSRRDQDPGLQDSPSNRRGDLLEICLRNFTLSVTPWTPPPVGFRRLSQGRRDDLQEENLGARPLRHLLRRLDRTFRHRGAVQGKQNFLEISCLLSVGTFHG